MNGYSGTGIGLFFAALVLLAFFLWHSHRLRRNSRDQDIRRAVTIIRLRNTAIILAMLAFSTFFLLLSSLSKLERGTAEYAMRDSLSAYALAVGLVLLAIAIYMGILSRKAEFNFKRLLQQYAVKEKLVAMLKFGRKRTPKPKQTNRV